MRDAFLKAQNDGVNVIEPAYLSTTATEKKVETLSGAGTRLEIELAGESTKGRPISKFSAKPQENEILFPKGSRFKVIGVEPGEIKLMETLDAQPADLLMCGLRKDVSERPSEEVGRKVEIKKSNHGRQKATWVKGPPSIQSDVVVGDRQPQSRVNLGDSRFASVQSVDHPIAPRTEEDEQIKNLRIFAPAYKRQSCLTNASAFWTEDGAQRPFGRRGRRARFRSFFPGKRDVTVVLHASPAARKLGSRPSR